MSEPEYGLGALSDAGEVPAPELPYLPRDPSRYRPPLALVGCGGISEYHLRAYRRAGLEVVALANPSRDKAEARRAEFFPEARVYAEHATLLEKHPEVEVVDVATHPEVRASIVADCLSAGRHVLAQKPFAHDLDEAERLVRLADERGRQLAVNQNGRWAPHLAWIREAVRAGEVGELASVDIAIHWDHSWVVGTPFDDTPHLLLFDFGVHWFDFIHTLFGARPPQRVTAAAVRSSVQESKQPMLAHASVEFPGGRATLALFGDARHLQSDTTLAAGSSGSLRAVGPDLQHQSVELVTERGRAVPRLEGEWFENGFHGALAELLCAIEEEREPTHSARDNLKTLELAFAACASASSGKAVEPGAVRSLVTP